jgi:hypothetical protein
MYKQKESRTNWVRLFYYIQLVCVILEIVCKAQLPCIVAAVAWIILNSR